jgi:hypothetical protein
VTKRSNFHVDRYGNAVLYCGRTFQFSAKSEQYKITPFGKIVDVVKKSKNSTDNCLYFKYYNHKEHRTPPPPASSMWKYEKCSSLMKVNKNNPLITLDAKNGCKELLGFALLNRKIQKRFKSWDDKNKAVFRFYLGTINNFADGLYSVLYEDGDFEQLDEKEVVKLLKP